VGFRTLGELLGIAMPAIGLALMPKCPACVAAYIAIGAGVGVSLTAASYLQTAAMALCGAMLLYFVVRAIRRCM
jgi:hypothetical protein